MNVTTVTTVDRSLLHAVLRSLAKADRALLAVAFVQEQGVHLLERELKGLRTRGAETRLLVTTVFGTTSPAALVLAADLGVAVRVLNPGAGSTYHPKLYLGQHGQEARGVIGSANLTGGLATNLEAAVALDGVPTDPPLAAAWDWAESLWQHPRAQSWRSPVDATPAAETIAEELLTAVRAEWSRDPVFTTLGRRPAQDLLVDVTPTALYLETDRSRSQGKGPQPVPAWMVNLAWDHLRSHGSLSNTTLLHELRVHRSSAVCAVLARLPGVEVVRGGEILLKWRGTE